MRILVVDDVSFNRKLITALCKKHGSHVIVEAENGEMAVSLFKADPFDLIFMDHMMPVMTGVEATRAIKDYAQRTGIDATICMVTAALEPEVMEHGYKVGMVTRLVGIDTFMTKPLNTNAVVSLIDTIAKKVTLKNQTCDRKKELEGEIETAARIIDRITKRQDLEQNDCLWALSKPANGMLSGDVVCLSREARSIRLIVADAMGHGVSAAVMSLPCRSMPPVIVPCCASFANSTRNSNCF